MSAVSKWVNFIYLTLLKFKRGCTVICGNQETVRVPFALKVTILVRIHLTEWIDCKHQHKSCNLKLLGTTFSIVFCRLSSAKTAATHHASRGLELREAAVFTRYCILYKTENYFIFSLFENSLDIFSFITVVRALVTCIRGYLVLLTVIGLRKASIMCMTHEA